MPILKKYNNDPHKKDISAHKDECTPNYNRIEIENESSGATVVECYNSFIPLITVLWGSNSLIALYLLRGPTYRVRLKNSPMNF